MFYLPFHQANTGFGEMTLVVRTAGDPTTVAAAVRRESQVLDSAMPMYEVETLATQVAASRLVSSQLFGISAADPGAIGLATLVLLIVAAVAGYLPARRATRVDPLVALSYE